MFLSYKKTTVLYLAVVFLLIADRFLKSLALTRTTLFPIFDGWFGFGLVKNYNVAFSLPLGGIFLNCLIVVIIGGLLVYFFSKQKKQEYWRACFSFAVILGASSNLFDRLKYGYVIDYLNLSYFSVFNLADALITAGVFCLAWYGFRLDKKITSSL